MPVPFWVVRRQPSATLCRALRMISGWPIKSLMMCWIRGRRDILGKSVGKDDAQDKSTFVSLLGVERAREQALQLSHQAVSYLDALVSVPSRCAKLPHLLFSGEADTNAPN